MGINFNLVMSLTYIVLGLIYMAFVLCTITSVRIGDAAVLFRSYGKPMIDSLFFLLLNYPESKNEII